MKYEEFESILQKKDRHVHILNKVIKEKQPLEDVVGIMKNQSYGSLCEHTHDFILSKIHVDDYVRAIKSNLDAKVGIEINIPFQDSDKALFNSLKNIDNIILSSHNIYYDVHGKRKSIRTFNGSREYINYFGSYIFDNKHYTKYFEGKQLIWGHPFKKLFENNSSLSNVEIMDDLGIAMNYLKQFNVLMEINLNTFANEGDTYADLMFKIIESYKPSLSLGTDIHIENYIAKQRAKLFDRLNRSLNRGNKDRLFNYIKEI